MQDLGDGTLGPVPGALAQCLAALEELNQQRMPKCYLMEFCPQLDSADMNPTDWTSIAAEVEMQYYDYSGFVVLHGTDTMAYTASALSFMLENLGKPVILTGSQLPFFEPLTDARQNLLGAIIFAGLADLCEVGLFFSGCLFRGNRSRKLNASSLEAFTSPCYPALAQIGAETNIYRRRLLESPRGRFHLQRIVVTQILVVWVIPGFSDGFLENLLQGQVLKGMVLLLYGCGNAPAKKAKLLRLLKTLVSTGVVIVAGTQCERGNVDLEKYAVGKAFKDCGVISARDMTPEATVTKLAYLLSKKLSPEQVRKCMGEDLRGEMTTEVTTFKIDEPATGLTAL